MKFYELKAISLRNPAVWAEKSPLSGCFSLGGSTYSNIQENYKSEYKKR